MLKWIKYNWLPVLSVLLSVVAICLNSPRYSQLGFDYTGVIAAVLSLLITILIGWNIYSALEIKRDIENFRNEMTNRVEGLDNRCATIAKNTENAFVDLQEKTKKALKKQESYFDGCIAFCQGLIKDDNHLMLKYKLFVEAIWHFCKCDNTEDYIKKCLCNMATVINKLNAGGKIEMDLDVDESFCISKGDICKQCISITQEQRESFYKLEKTRRDISIKHKWEKKSL